MATQKGGSDKKEAILLLSSEPAVRAVATDILQDAGYTVQAAADLVRAVGEIFKKSGR